MAFKLPIARADFETRSEADLKKVGAYKYAQDPTTSVMCLAFRVPGGELDLWHPNGPDEVPTRLLEWVKAGNLLEAHNAEFEYAIWNYHCVPKYGWPKLSISQVRCSAAKAAALALPRALEDVGAALRLPVQKDKEGHRIMLKMSKPRKPTKNNPAKWHDSFEDSEKLFEYCQTDVRTEELASEILPPLLPKEQKLFELTMRINERGIYCDVPLCKTAVSFSEKYETDLTEELHRITGGEVQTAKQVQKLTTWLMRQGVALDNAQAKTIDDALKDSGIEGDARRVLEIRQALSKSSVKKYTSMIQMAGADQRIRGTLLFNGASTGRYTGKGIQPQNFARGVYKDTKNIFELLEAVDYDFFKAVFPDVFTALSSGLRGMLRAAPGFELMAGDYNAVEARGVMWLANDETGLSAFRSGRDIYREMASAIFGIPVSRVTDQQRFIGKETILGCLAKDTKVLTEKGFIQIQNITKDLKVWDGEKWVPHGGVISKGLKSVIKIDCIKLESTPCHRILTSDGWRSAGEIALYEAILPQKLVKKWVLSRLRPQNLKGVLSVVSKYAAYAEMKKNFELINSGLGSVLFATLVTNRFLDKKEKEKPETLISYLIQDLEKGGPLVTTILGSDVSSRMTKTSRGMAVAEFPYPSNRCEIFWNTLLHCAGLINGASPWTELITTDTMPLETYELLVKGLTTEIKETFDIENVGEHNCFMTEKSFVHNCGFGMGWKKFKQNCWDKYRVEISEELAKKCIYSYREMHEPVKRFWYDLEEIAIESVKNPGKLYKFRNLQFLTKEMFFQIQLPSGRRLSYFTPRVRVETTEWGPKEQLAFLSVDPTTKQFGRETTYGGKLTENVTQAVARDIMTDAMLRLDDMGFPLIMTVHDELVAEVKEGERKLDDFLSGMAEVPSWANGFPIKVAGWNGPRYKK